MAFFKPKWMTMNPQKAQKAIDEINRITDQNLLLQIIREAPVTSVAIAALDRIDDQKLLYRIAVESREKAITRSAIRRITDASLLSDYIKRSPYEPFIADTIKRIESEQILDEIATTVSSVATAQAAIQLINDQNKLKNYAFRFNDSRGKTAAERITDQEVLKELVCKAPCEETGLEAAKRITSPKDARELIRNSTFSNPKIVEHLIQRIPEDDEKTLQLIYKNYPHAKNLMRMTKEKLDTFFENRRQANQKAAEQLYLHQKRDMEPGKMAFSCPECGSEKLLCLASCYYNDDSNFSYDFRFQTKCENCGYHSGWTNLPDFDAYSLVLTLHPETERQLLICPRCRNIRNKNKEYFLSVTCKCSDYIKAEYIAVGIKIKDY